MKCIDVAAEAAQRILFLILLVPTDLVVQASQAVHDWLKAKLAD